jgi:WD40 repeat protein
MSSSSYGPRPPPLQVPAIPDHELLRLIGSGAYGQVWLARNCLGTWRAVKIVYREAFESERPYEREIAGVRHAEPVSRTHPNHVAILHVGADDEAGCFYFVMELADDEATGQDINPDSYNPRTLQSELRLRRRLPVGECISVGIALAEALDHLHQHSLVHRDLKPANVVYIRGQPRLTDIGLTCRANSGASIVGTDGFIPPEGPGSPAGDVFSLGKVLYELATGFDRHRYPELPTFAAEQSGREQQDLIELNQVILRACEANPARRYSEARQLLADLRLVQAGVSVVRMRRMERALRRLRTATVAAALTISIGSGAYLYQMHHNRIVAAYAEENHRLAEKRRDELISTLVDAGVRQLDDGRHHHALLSFARALEAAAGDADRELPHRVRMQSMLAAHPRLIGILEHGDWVRYTEFNRTGDRLVTASDDGTARVWDAFNGTPLTAPLLHEGPVHWAHFSPSQDKIVTAGKSHRAGLWDIETGRLDVWLEHGEGEIFSAAFSSDGSRLVTAGADMTARIWSESGALLLPPLPHPDRVYTASFSPDESILLTTSRDGVARIWNAATGQPLGIEVAHLSPLSMAVFSPDGSSVVSVSLDGMAKVWKPLTGELITERKHAKAVLGAVFSPCGRWVATGERENKSLFIWSAATGEVIQSFAGNLSAEPRFSPDGAFIAYSSYGTEVHIASILTGNLLRTPLSSGWFDAAPFSPRGSRIAVPSTRDGMVKIWDLAGAGTQEFVSNEPALRLRYSRDGALLATAGAKARVWDVREGQPIGPPLETESFAGLLDFSPDSRRLLTAGGADFFKFFGNTWDHSHSVQVWDLAAGELAFPALVPGGCTYYAAFSDDGRFVVTAGSNRKAQLWDADSGELLLDLEHEAAVWHAAVSPDGGKVATCSGSVVQVWDATSGVRILPPLVHDGVVDYAAFSPDGKWIASAAFHRQTLSIWNTQNGKLVHQATLPGEVARFELSEEGTLLTYGFGCASIRQLPWLQSSGRAFCHDAVMEHATLNSEHGRLLTLSTKDLRAWDVGTAYPLTPSYERLAIPGVARHSKRNPLRAPATLHPDGLSFAVTADAYSTFTLSLAPDPRPVQDLVQMAQLLGTEPRPRNSPPPLREKTDLWNRLREKYPVSFAPDENGRWQWHRRMAHSLQAEGQNEAALWHLNEMIELQPDRAETFIRRGRLRLQTATGIGAKEDFETAVSLRGTVADHFELILLLAGRGETVAGQRAVEEMVTAHAASGHLPTLLLVMWAAILSGDVSSAVHGELQSALQRRFGPKAHARNPEVALILGGVALRSGAVDDALAHLNRALRLCTGEEIFVDRATLPRVWGLLAQTHALRGDREESARYTQLLEAHLPRTPPASEPHLGQELKILRNQTFQRMDPPS